MPAGQDSVAARLRAIERRIAAACSRSGRDPRTVSLVGACKQQPPERLLEAAAAGLRAFGENRVQEGVARSVLVPEAEWHLLGPLQSNKVRPAVRVFSAVHSVDRPEIAQRLDREAARQGRSLTGFLEVNLADEESKHGFSAADLPGQVEALARLDTLRLVGLMAIPPFEEDLEAARRWFRALRALRDELFTRPEWRQRPGHLSMGMSHDFEPAIEEGATHVRIGTALFGPR